MNTGIKSYRLHTLAALVCITAAVNAAPAEGNTSARRPALVVNIIVDGLDMDRIDQLRDAFGQGGFNRLIAKGVTITDLDYGSDLDRAAATAMLVTGSSPAVSGIASETIYDASRRYAVPVLADPSVMGNFTDETYSPSALRVSTLSDEMRIDTGGLGLVHSVAVDPSQAILLAGHAGNSAVWIADDTGKWASSTYFTELPTSIQQINRLRPLPVRLDTLSWTPSMPKMVYDYLPSYKKIYSFRHNFTRGDADRYKSFKASSPANSEVTSVAVDYLKVLNMGKREPVDMLSLAYNLQPYAYGRDPDTRAELLDSYCSLDRNLERLFKAIDTLGPGMDRTLVVVAGTPVDPSVQRDDEKYRIPSGEFSTTRAISLLKVFLISELGNGDWVTGYHDGQIYLNRDLIRDRGKDLEAIRRLTADFLRRMSGVTFAATADEVVTASSTSENPFPPARNIDIDTAGDVFVAVAPGWTITDGQSQSRPVVVRSQGQTAPAFILYPPVGQRVLTSPVDARTLAPTVARLLRIRSPNGAQLPPLRF